MKRKIVASVVLGVVLMGAKPGNSIDVAEGHHFTEQAPFVFQEAFERTAWAHVLCYQPFGDGQHVVLEGYVQAAPGAFFTLGPTPSWSSGGAECVAEIGYFDQRQRYRAVADDTFTVLP